ncbi:MAG: hypothetical protein KC609_21775 [Myxococcales bacterium]|nr:hypothetical protein [Myxococcales bacterium]
MIIGLATAAFAATLGPKTAPGKSSKRRKPPLVAPKDEPIHIASKRLIYNNETQIARFIGKVIATQGDMTIRSEVLDAYYKGKDGRLERIIAWRNVVIDKSGTLARSERAIFDNDKRTVVLLGNPRVIRKDSVLTGKRMTLYLDRDVVMVEGAQGRISVQANKLPWLKKKKGK